MSLYLYWSCIRFVPETLRAIVGDGSIRPSLIHRAVIPIVGRNRIAQSPESPDSALPRKKAFKNPFVLLKNPDIFVILFFNGVVSAVYYAVTATISTLFSAAYPFLTEIQIGLCFLSIGGECLVQALIVCGIWLRDCSRTQEVCLPGVYHLVEYWMPNSGGWRRCISKLGKVRLNRRTIRDTAMISLSKR